MNASDCVLVTGGAGFVGSHLVERLASAGTHVEVVDSLVRGRREWLPAGVSPHVVDLRDADAVRDVVDAVRPTVVAHLAAVHYIPEVDGAPAVARAVNVDGTRNLLAALAAAPPRRLLFASTGAVYPDQRGPLPESCPAAPIDLYGETKVAGERLVERFGDEVGARVVVARLFNVIGRRETNRHVVPELVGQLRRGATAVRLGALDRVRDYTDVVDVARALVALLEPGVAERLPVVNVGSGAGTSVRELVASCERILGRPIEVESDPARQRAQDRVELVADVGLLRGVISVWPSQTVAQTLEQLLLFDDGEPDALDWA